jgi:hypothetical protein
MFPPVRSAARRLFPRGRGSCALLVPFGIVLLVLCLLAWHFWHDMPRESDEDLRLPLPVAPLPEVHPAPLKLRAFLDAVRPLQQLSLRALPPADWDTPALSAHVRANGTALDNLRDLLEDADWHPRHGAWFTVDLSGHEGWPHVIFLLQAQAAYLARRGEEAEAFTAATDLAELSRRVLELNAWPGYVWRAQDLGAGAAQTFAELLRQTRLDAATLAGFQEQFARCEPGTELMRQYCAAFYLHEKKCLLGDQSGEPPETLPPGVPLPRAGRLTFKVNATLALVARACRDLRDEFSRPAYAAAGGFLTSLPNGRPAPFYDPNRDGVAWFNDRLGSLRPLAERHALALARHGLVRVLFAARRHAAEHRRLPASLGDLVPAYLAAVPVDPFTGEPFVFDPVRGLIYSAGADCLSSNGRASLPPLSDDNEPTVRLGRID